MRLKEVSKKKKTEHFYQSELEYMSDVRKVSEKAKEAFKRKPYKMKVVKDEE